MKTPIRALPIITAEGLLMTVEWGLPAKLDEMSGCVLQLRTFPRGLLVVVRNSLPILLVAAGCLILKM